MKKLSAVWLGLAALVLLISGCATTERLQQKELVLNYNQHALSDSRYVISVTSNHGAEWAEIKSFLVEKAAKLTVSQSFSTFELENIQQFEDVKLETVPAVSGSGLFRNETAPGLDARPGYTLERYVRSMTAEVVMSR